MFKKALKKLSLLGLIPLISSCASIQKVGNIGPKKLPVYIIAQNDFLSANRMMVILDKKGNVSAYTGGTIAGPGTVALSAAGEFATAGAIAYGANAIKSGLQNSHVKVTGIPKKASVDANININNVTESK